MRSGVRLRLGVDEPEQADDHHVPVETTRPDRAGGRLDRVFVIGRGHTARPVEVDHAEQCGHRHLNHAWRERERERERSLSTVANTMATVVESS